MSRIEKEEATQQELEETLKTIGMLRGALADALIIQQASEAQAQETIEKLRTQLEYTASMMERARVILQHNPGNGNWGMLDTRTARALLAETAPKPLPDQWAKALSDPDEWDNMIR